MVAHFGKRTFLTKTQMDVIGCEGAGGYHPSDEKPFARKRGGAGSIRSLTRIYTMFVYERKASERRQTDKTRKNRRGIGVFCLRV